jgi:cytidylate kinase
VQLNGQDVTWAIRSPEVEQHVSQISKYPAVRAEMVRQQRHMGQVGRVVMVGRDIGTVVLPNAPLKLYITASPEERARRRLADHEGQGVALGYEEMLQDIVRRDGIDGGREHSPMKAAEDAILIDSSDHTPEALVSQILNLWQVKHEV